MEDTINQRRGCAYLGLISLVASGLGSVLAAVIFSMMHGGGSSDILLAIIIALYFGGAIAIPIGVFVGIRMLAVSGGLMSRHVVFATLLFAIIGLLGGLVLKHVGGDAGLANAELIFGACVGGLHPLVYGRAKGVGWPSILAALSLSAVLMPSAAFAGESVQNLIDSRNEFESRCTDRYGSMAVVADRAELEQLGAAVRRSGAWQNQLRWRSLYEWEDRVPLDAARVLIARDYAYVPSGFAGWVTGGRRVERHCLSGKKGRQADMLRRLGFGKPPNLRDLAD